MDIEHGSSDSAISEAVSERRQPFGNYSSSTRVGVAIFDSDGMADTGWACVAGDTPFRVKSPFASLSTDTIWWTNLSPERVSGNTPRTVRSNNYFKVTVNQAIMELGLQGQPPNELAKHLAFHFRVIARMVEKFSDKPFAYWAKNKAFHQDMNGVAGPAPTVPRGIANSFLGQDGKWFFTTVENVRTSETILFRQPRLAYALDLLSRSVPGKPITWKQSAEDPMDVIRRTVAPVYAEYSLKSAHSKVAQLFGLAQQGGKVSSPSREFAAHPELLCLDAFATVQVKEFWQGANQYDYLPAADTLPPNLVSALNGKYAAYSWGMGIIAQALLIGITSPFVVQSRAGNLTWRGIWLRAADKVAMFGLSLVFQKCGYRPASYGHGWIRVVRPDKPINNDGLLLVAMRHGLLPDPGEMDPVSISNVVSNKYGPAKPEAGWLKAAFVAHIVQTGNFKLAQMTNDLPLLTGERLEKRRDLLAQSLKTQT